MVKFAANLTMLYEEYPQFERFAHAARSGFKAAEFFFPYESAASEWLDALEKNDLELVLFNMPLGDWDAGERGFAAHPSRVADFEKAIDQAVAYGKALKPPRINCPSGPAEPRQAPYPTLARNMTKAARALEAIGIQLVVEPVNRNDVPGAVVSTVAEAFELFEQVESDNIALQYDLYHSLRAGEDPFEIIPRYIDRIAHIQVADVPGRHQFGTGAVDFVRLFRLLDKLGYDGWVSLEYHPDGPTDASFDRLRELEFLPSA